MVLRPPASGLTMQGRDVTGHGAGLASALLAVAGCTVTWLGMAAGFHLLITQPYRELST
jgi:hypothetical protein